MGELVGDGVRAEYSCPTWSAVSAKLYMRTSRMAPMKLNPGSPARGSLPSVLRVYSMPGVGSWPTHGAGQSAGSATGSSCHSPQSPWMLGVPKPGTPAMPSIIFWPCV